MVAVEAAVEWASPDLAAVDLVVLLRLVVVVARRPVAVERVETRIRA